MNDSTAATTVSAAMETRRSVRAFLDRPVDPQVLRDVIARAGRAASGGNLQPWRLYVLGGDELQRVKDAAAARLKANPSPDPMEYPIYPENLGEPYRTHRYRVGEALYATIGIPREDKMRRLAQFANNFQFFGAPVGMFCYIDRLLGAAQWSDLGMYLQSLMLLLRERGLDSCPQECWSIYNRLIGDLVQAPPELMLFCGMAIGYAAPEAPINRLRTERMALEEFVTFRGI